MKCIICKSEHNGSYGKSGKYCSKSCRYTFTEEHKEKIAGSLKGVRKPYLIGVLNPNFGGKYSNDPVIHEKFLNAVKFRGQGWNDDLKNKHSVVMMGESNWMRGKCHSEDTKQKIREKVISDFASGKRKPNRTMVSKPERDIARMLSDIGLEIKMGIRVRNNLYDIFIPTKNLIIKFNGDYWHMNPSKYSSDSYNKACGMTAAEIWERDNVKINNAKENGYQVHCIWEDDYEKSNDKKAFLQEIISKYEE